MINQYWELVLLLCMLNAMFALSLNLILGYNGQFSLGHAGFIAIGAYTSGVLTDHFGVPLFGAVALAVVNSVIFAAIIGWPTLRLRGDYLAIATLGFAEIIKIVLLALPSDIFGGPTGMQKVDNLKKFVSLPGLANGLLNFIFAVAFALLLAALTIWAAWSFINCLLLKLNRFRIPKGGKQAVLGFLGLLFSLLFMLKESRELIFRSLEGIFLFKLSFSQISRESEQGMMFLIYLLLLALVTWLIRNFLNSAQGRAVVSIREDEVAAMNLGINISWMKLQNFMFACGVAGLGGALLAHTIPLFTPRSFDLFRSVDVLLMVVLGGMGSITGSFLGALAITIPLEALRFLGAWRLVIYALLLIIMMITRPGGMLGGHELGELLRFPRRKAAPDPGAANA